MSKAQILQVKSRHGKPQPRVNDAAKKANVEIEIQSRPFQDDLLVTVLGSRVKEKMKAPKAKPKTTPKPAVAEPRTRCFGRMYQKSNSANVDIFS
jgi:hypothetical protein